MGESSGDTMVPEELRRELRGLYPEARLAQLKAGGDFPYLSRPEEATMFIEVHMRSAGAGIFSGGLAADPHLPAAPQGQIAAALPACGRAGDFVEAPVKPPPERPKWKNPFEDDP